MSEYLNKIYFKLNKSELYSSKYDAQVAELSKRVILDVMPTNKPTLQETTLSWSGFADLVLRLIAAGADLTYENLESVYAPKAPSPRRWREVEIDPALLVEEDPKEKMERLLSIADEADILDCIDPDIIKEEGWRSANVIDKDQTSLDGYDLVFKSDMPILRVKEGETIESPFTGSTNIYRIDEIHFLDIETDEVFKVFIV